MEMLSSATSLTILVAICELTVADVVVVVVSAGDGAVAPCLVDDGAVERDDEGC